MIRSVFYFWTGLEIYKQIICLGDDNDCVTFSDSDQDGLQQFLSASNTTWSSLFRNKIKTQSIMRMIRCGGLGSLRTVAIWAALMVWGQINLNSLISWFPSFPKLSNNMGDGKWILHWQRAKKVVSDSPGLVDFTTGLVKSVFNLPDGQVMFFEEFK